MIIPDNHRELTRFLTRGMRVLGDSSSRIAALNGYVMRDGKWKHVFRNVLHTPGYRHVAIWWADEDGYDQDRMILPPMDIQNTLIEGRFVRSVY